MSNEIRTSTINKLALRYGLIMGAISIVLSLAFWIVNPLMQYTDTWVSLLMLVIVIVLLVLFGIEIRKVIGGYWTFGEAFKALLLMAVITSILSVIFHYILFNFIDPTLAQRASDAVIAKLNESLSNSGVSQEKIDDIAKSINGKFDANAKNEAINLGVGIIIYGIISLIIAAAIKKNPPLQPIIEEDPTV